MGSHTAHRTSRALPHGASGGWLAEHGIDLRSRALGPADRVQWTDRRARRWWRPVRLDARADLKVGDVGRRPGVDGGFVAPRLPDRRRQALRLFDALVVAALRAERTEDGGQHVKRTEGAGRRASCTRPTSRSPTCGVRRGARSATRASTLRMPASLKSRVAAVVRDGRIDERTARRRRDEGARPGRRAVGKRPDDPDAVRQDEHEEQSMASMTYAVINCRPASACDRATCARACDRRPRDRDDRGRRATQRGLDRTRRGGTRHAPRGHPTQGWMGVPRSHRRRDDRGACGATVDVETSSGDVRVGVEVANAQVQSGSGDVFVERVTEDARVATRAATCRSTRWAAA